MTGTHRAIIGVDPGGTTGVAWLSVWPRGSWAQCTAATGQLQSDEVTTYVDSIMRYLATEGVPITLAIEKWVQGRKGLAHRGLGAARVESVITDLLTMYGRAHGVRIVQRSASEVKPWATDARLYAAGLLDHTRGMPHARDATRHALYSACRDHGARDPLSTKQQTGA